MSFGGLFSAIVGLVVIYYVFSYLVSTLAGQVEIFLDIRARRLEAQLTALFQDSGKLDAFVQHPLFTSLTPKVRKSLGFIPPWRGSSGVSHLPSSTFAMTLIDILIPQGQSKTIQSLQNAIHTLPAESGLRAELGALLDSTTTEIQVTRKLVETWFDSHMDKVSDLYRRYMKTVVVILAVVVTLVFNLDTLEIMDSLLESPLLREIVVSQADEFLEAAEGIDAQQQVDALVTLNLPLGWDFSNFPTGNALISKVLGLAISALALSQGAPFWYNILKQLRGQNTNAQATSA